MTQLALAFVDPLVSAALLSECPRTLLATAIERGREGEIRAVMSLRRRQRNAARMVVARARRSVPTLPPAETWAEPPVPRGPEPVVVRVVLTLGRDWARQLRLYAIARAAEAARRTT